MRAAPPHCPHGMAEWGSGGGLGGGAAGAFAPPTKIKGGQTYHFAPPSSKTLDMRDEPKHTKNLLRLMLYKGKLKFGSFKV